MAEPEEEKDYVVAAEPKYAYYSRYNRRSMNDWPHEAEDLTCPYCGAEEIVCLDDTISLGNRARCWMCKQVFTITQNCWRFRAINNPKY